MDRRILCIIIAVSDASALCDIYVVAYKFSTWRRPFDTGVKIHRIDGISHRGLNVKPFGHRLHPIL